MNVLITGAASQLGQQIIAELVSNHQLRLLDSTIPDIKHENLDAFEGFPTHVFLSGRFKG